MPPWLRSVALYGAGVLVVGVTVVAWMYWSWSRITSDVPVLAPPEWPWLAGRTELKVLEDRDVLLIRRVKEAEPDVREMNLDVASEEQRRLVALIQQR